MGEFDSCQPRFYNKMRLSWAYFFILPPLYQHFFKYFRFFPVSVKQNAESAPGALFALKRSRFYHLIDFLERHASLPFSSTCCACIIGIRCFQKEARTKSQSCCLRANPKPKNISRLSIISGFRSIPRIARIPLCLGALV